VSFVAQALKSAGLYVDQVEVQDNNDIDREVTRFKPDICIVEALWVVPEKFDVLKRLHPKVRWFIHMHSGLPFLALEGIAMEWLKGYSARNIGILANSKDTFDAFQVIAPKDLVSFLPNIYLEQGNV
jgi:hypothetical protein